VCRARAVAVAPSAAPALPKTTATMASPTDKTTPLKLGSHDDLPSGGSGGSPSHAVAVAAGSHARRRRALAAGKVAGLVALGAGIALAVALPLLLPAARRGGAAANSGPDTLASSSSPPPSGNARRQVYLQAEPLEWNYNPHEKGSDYDGCHGVALVGDGLLSATGGPLGPTATKAVWRQYEDASFEKRLEQDAHLGVLGPTLHAEVGDALVVTVRNSLPFPVNFEAGGLELVSSSASNKNNNNNDDLASAPPAGPPPVLNPNSTATLTWRVPENAGPARDPPDQEGSEGGAAAPTRPWFYRSTHDQVAQTQAGLYGVIAVAKRGGLDTTTGRPRGVDREFVLVMQAFKDEMSPLFAADAAKAARRLLTPAAPVATGKNASSSALRPRLTKADAKLLAAIDDAEASGDDGALAEAAKAVLVSRGGEAGGELDGGEDGLLVASTKHAINGYLYCTLPRLDIVEGERVRWYVGAFGSEEALHTAHWHGEVLQGAESGRRSDQIVVQSAEAKALDMAPADNVGTWLLHCHLDDHMMHGMLAMFRVQPRERGGEQEQGDDAALDADAEAARDGQANGGRKLLLTARPPNSHRRALRAGDAAPDGGTVREHFIAAETVEWDYAPFGGEMCTGELEPFGEGASVFLGAGPDRLGRKYLKAQYVAYTDGTFTQRARVGPEWEHLGMVGPVLRAEVGDMLKVTFLNRVGLPTGGGNNGSSSPSSLLPRRGAKTPTISMHPHGVLYTKSSEGALYEDGTKAADRQDDAVPPGKQVVYEWRVPERSGPGPGDPSSVFWIYHSHTEEATDHHAGLFGGIIVTRKGLANEDLTPKDVDR
jgi:FtsP/CotA-like multicopper oxidase with cupredoxin domain